MIEGLPQQFSNLIMSLSFIDTSNFLDRNYIEVNDYVDLILNNIMEYPGVYLLSRKIPIFYISKIILLLEYYNSYQYKSELIVEKLLYIIFYYIQNRLNITKFFREKYISCYDKLDYLKYNIDTIRPNTRHFLDMIMFDIDNYILECRIHCHKIVDKELDFLPHDIIKIIVEYMPNTSIIQVAEIFL